MKLNCSPFSSCGALKHALTDMRNGSFESLISVCPKTELWQKVKVTTSKHVNDSRERLFIMTETHSLHILGAVPFVKLQNDT